MKKINGVLAILTVVTSTAWAQQVASSPRAAYMQQQALAEVPRLLQQFDLLVQNQEAMATRLVKLESQGEDANMRAEIDALRAEIAELKAALRRDQDAMRREIVADLSQRISKMAPPAPAAVASVPAPTGVARTTSTRTPPPPPAQLGPHYEYLVEKGQTLARIAEGFGTTVPKILAANPGLKPNSLRVGQKLIIPAEELATKPAASTKPAAPIKPAPKGKKGKR